MIKIIDNLLDEKDIKTIEDCLTGDLNFAWYLVNHVAKAEINDGYYFIHEFYKHNQIKSNYFPILEPVLKILEPKALIRIKANLYPGSPTLVEHGQHVDYVFKHNAFILYINTNNGFTRFGENKIDSIRNRGLSFDGSKEHNSTNCTDQNYRININFSYF